MKKAGPKPSKAKREEWKRENRENDKEYRKEKKRRQKAKKREEQESRNAPRPVTSETEWFQLVEKAGDRSDFELLLQLFSQHLLDHTRTASDNPLKSVLKRFRELSTRYHPDKHGAEASRYSLMFQALNEARDVVVAEFA